jgi:cell wall-associated NlpC family hydrolase
MEACIPAGLSEERAAVLMAALSLEGKVSYLWGGKSASIGWDANWGKTRTLLVQDETAEPQEGEAPQGTAEPKELAESQADAAPGEEEKGQEEAASKPRKKEKTVIMGLDCSGFVCWTMINGYGDKSIKDKIGLGSSNQWNHSVEIEWAEAQPGDWVFYRPPSSDKGNHIGILLGIDGNGNWLVVHCTTGKGVVVTDAKKFAHVRRPNIYES